MTAATEAAPGVTQPIAPIPEQAVNPATGDAGSAAPTAADGQAAEEEQQGDATRTKSYIRVKVGNLEFDSSKGDILGQPWIHLRTHQFSVARFVINDPRGVFFKEIDGPQDAEIAVGWVGGESENVLKGKVFHVGRIPPDGTEVEVIDPGAAMQASGTSVQNANATPATGQTEEQAQAEKDKEAGASGEATDAPANDSSVDQTARQDDPTEEGASAVDPLNPNERPTNAFGELQRLLGEAGKIVRSDRTRVTPAQQFAREQGLEFASNTLLSTFDEGSLRVNQGGIHAATKQAQKQGDVLVTRGDTVRQVSPGQGDPTGVVLNYSVNRPAFLASPKVIKRTGIQLANAVGAMTVQGWSANNKTAVGATVVTPGGDLPHPTGTITAPEWGDITLSDKILGAAGKYYTWADATKNGSRPPESKSVVEQIIAICEVIEQFTDQTGGAKWEINSWYRPPHVNAAVSSTGLTGPHTTGNAVDFYFAGMNDLYQKLNAEWDGGVAQKAGSFTHIDLGARRRWSY